jgi:hypothetical protein
MELFTYKYWQFYVVLRKLIHPFEKIDQNFLVLQLKITI